MQRFHLSVQVATNKSAEQLLARVREVLHDPVGAGIVLEGATVRPQAKPLATYKPDAKKTGAQSA